MSIGIFVFFALVLYGLIASTEKVLQNRERYVVLDERMTEHRSRM